MPTILRLKTLQAYERIVLSGKEQTLMQKR